MSGEEKTLHTKATDYIIALLNRALAVQSASQAKYFLSLLLKELKALKSWIQQVEQNGDYIKIGALIRATTVFENVQQNSEEPLPREYYKELGPLKEDLRTLFEEVKHIPLNDAVTLADEMINTIQGVYEKYVSHVKETEEQVNLEDVIHKGDTLKNDKGVYDVIGVEGNQVFLLNPEGEKESIMVDSKEDIEKLKKMKSSEHAFQTEEIKPSRLNPGDILPVQGGEYWVVINKKPNSDKFKVQSLTNPESSRYLDIRKYDTLHILTDEGAISLIKEFLDKEYSKNLPDIIKEEYDYLFKV